MSTQKMKEKVCMNICYDQDGLTFINKILYQIMGLSTWEGRVLKRKPRTLERKVKHLCKQSS